MWVTSFALVAAYVLAPLTSPALIFAAYLPAVWHASPRKQYAIFRSREALLVLGIVGTYLSVNASWSLAPSFGYASAAFYVAVAAGLLMTVSALSAFSPVTLRALALGVPLGLALGAAFLFFEVFTGQRVRLTLMALIPSMVSNSPDAVIENGLVRFLPLNLLNRSAFAFSLCFWFALFIVRWLYSEPRAQVALYGALALGVVSVLASDHQTSQLAFVGSGLAYLTLRLAPVLARRLVTLAWLAATVLVVPICMVAYSQELYRATWMQSSAQQRIVIWGYVAEQVPNAPFLGIGIGTPHVQNKGSQENATHAPGSTYVRTAKGHAHNAFLQTWYEIGAVGAGLLLVLGLLVLRSMNRAPHYLQPYLYAGFVTWAILASSTFNLWARWFMASVAVALLLGSLCISVARGPERENDTAATAP